ncbi:L-2-hydroxyglutarate oxidase LhgO [Actinacidiphila yanglinensis]|uniref:L-2-hydroxyglutarate oxidase LhgO n=1 Tax=Actinacidiphila yanglinensis TaxID=310779 RepID=A0A1H5XFQ4_9ACTN|nr:L-2-hydroxyglutarate oxidase [Actinacidiphila yanglinensis]SEG10581.1 L-2-hydroxyglutarate oxidase LhgO [Actinacidiphila yanglinensis]
MDASKPVGVVGAGLIGLAVARRLALRGEEVVVFDKEDDVAVHQSGHNSGVVHSGLYYPPGSLKATLCRRGVGLLKDFCAEHDLPYREIGKVVVARSPVEVERLGVLEQRARANGVPGVRRLDPAALREIEPEVRGLAALHSPTTAIVDFRGVARAMAEEITAAGGRVLLGHEVTAIRPGPRGGTTVNCGGQEYALRGAVICAGLQSDTVAGLAGDSPSPAIVAFRGEYYRLRPERAGLVRGLVYPVPDPAYPFLGVHLTPRVDGTVDVGPNAVLALAREGYRRRDVHPRELARALAWPGTRRLVRRHWRTGLRELRGSLSRRAFAAEAARYVPALTAADLVPAPAGVRAQALDERGALVDDFRISVLGPVTAVRNAPSPAATSCLAIAEHVTDRLDLST